MVALDSVLVCHTRERPKRMRRTVRLLASVGTAVLLASVVLVTVIDSARPIAPTVERPNIIFVLTDD